VAWWLRELQKPAEIRYEAISRAVRQRKPRFRTLTTPPQLTSQRQGGSCLACSVPSHILHPTCIPSIRGGWGEIGRVCSDLKGMQATLAVLFRRICPLHSVRALNTSSRRYPGHDRPGADVSVRAYSVQEARTPACQGGCGTTHYNPTVQ
jgi:hypothetical protein